MKFKFRLNAISILLLVAVTLVCGYGIALNVIALINAIETLKIILNVILMLINLALIVTVFAIALFSNYSIDKKGIILRLGFFKVVYKKIEGAYITNSLLFSRYLQAVLWEKRIYSGLWRSSAPMGRRLRSLFNFYILKKKGRWRKNE